MLARVGFVAAILCRQPLLAGGTPFPRNVIHPDRTNFDVKHLEPQRVLHAHTLEVALQHGSVARGESGANGAGVGKEYVAVHEGGGGGGAIVVVLFEIPVVGHKHVKRR